MADPKKLAKATPQPEKSKKQQIVPISDARTFDLQEEVTKLRADVDSHHGEQKQIIVGAVIATAVALLLVTVGVVVQLFIFNSMFKDSLDKVKEAHFQDYKELQKSVSDAKDEMNESKEAMTKEISDIKTTLPN